MKSQLMMFLKAPVLLISQKALLLADLMVPFHRTPTDHLVVFVAVLVLHHESGSVVSGEKPEHSHPSLAHFVLYWSFAFVDFWKWIAFVLIVLKRTIW
jgi:hypothetical protein